MKWELSGCACGISAPGTKKRIAYAICIKKWKVEIDKECQTVMWLDCDTGSLEQNFCDFNVVFALSLRPTL